jgi:hypothetical protein
MTLRPSRVRRVVEVSLPHHRALASLDLMRLRQGILLNLCRNRLGTNPEGRTIAVTTLLPEAVANSALDGLNELISLCH